MDSNCVCWPQENKLEFSGLCGEGGVSEQCQCWGASGEEGLKEIEKENEPYLSSAPFPQLTNKLNQEAAYTLKGEIVTIFGFEKTALHCCEQVRTAVDSLHIHEHPWYCFSGEAIVKCYRPGGLNNRKALSHSSGAGGQR